MTTSTANASVVPAWPAPSGQTADLSGASPYLTHIITSFSIILPIFACVVVTRLFIQCYISDSLNAEDYVLIVASPFVVAALVEALHSARYGSGAHIWNVSAQNWVEQVRILSIFSPLYLTALACIKTAILLQIMRILSPFRVDRPTWHACCICIIINLISYTAFIFLGIFRCSPVYKTFNLLLPGHCLSLATVTLTVTFFNCFSDFAILIVPMPIILRLKISISKRLQVAALFATGLLACITSVVRLYYAWKDTHSIDVSFYLYYEGLWCTIEMLIGVVVFCMPVFPKLYKSIQSRIRSSRSIIEENPAAN